MSVPLVEVDGISKKFCRRLKRSLVYATYDMGRELTGRRVTPELRPDEFWALQDISFSLARGEALGIVGPNGAGKSTLLKILTGIIKPTTGRVVMRGLPQALIELGSGMSPVLTGRENIYINAAVLGIPREVVDQRLDAIIDFADIREFIDTPVQNYSSGMKVRLGFAIAIHVEPDILIIDEVLSVGDQRFRQKARGEMQRLLDRDVALIFISHNIHEVLGITQKAIWIDGGRIRMAGPSAAVCNDYMQASLDGSIGKTGVLRDAKMSGDVLLSDIREGQRRVEGQAIEVTDSRGPLVLDCGFRCERAFSGGTLLQLSLTTVDGTPAGYVNLRDRVDLAEGEETRREIELDLADLQPGEYVLGMVLGTEGGANLDSLKQVLLLDRKRDAESVSTPVKPGGPVRARMLNNQRGSWCLPARLRAGRE